MMNRISNRLIARFVAFAALLALVMAAPAVFAQESISYEEGDTEPVATFSATDPDGDPIVWSLSGADAEDFTIEGGVLAFKSSPNYESPKDQGSDNTYNVTVNASGGSTDVEVTVTNVDEVGTVGLSDLQPQGGESLTATVSDEDSDSLDQVTWQWSKSMAEDGGWSDISGATSPTYTPKAGDVGYYLRATAEYSDGLGAGRDSASGVTAFAVEERPVANAQPVFADDNDDVDGAQQSRDVRETAKVGDSVGNAVTASDADNDPLLYTLTDGDEDTGTDGVQHVNSDSDTDTDGTATPNDRDGHSTNFKIDRKTGQITTAKEMPDQDVDTPDAESYNVIVTATDPSGSMNTVALTITIVNVNEPPVITVGDDVTTAFTLTRVGGDFVVTTPEQQTLDLDPEADDTTNVFAADLPVFDARDPEESTDAANEDRDKITWSLSGPDAKRFDIAKVVDAQGDSAPNTNFNSSAALRWSADNRLGPSFEDMDSADGDNFYDITVTAFDGVSSKSQAVNIEVTNQEEFGSVSLSQRVPQQGIAITAKLSDQDAGITGAKWQWYRGGTKTLAADADDPRTDDGDIEGLVTILTDPTDLTTVPANCADDTADGTLCTIEGATSATYTPVLADANNLLTARVTYTDGLGAETNSARATSESNARERRDANTLPSFGDDESVDRSVEENANKTNVGEPVAATDSDMGDLLLYTISDTTNFSVDDNGQIKTAKALDYETQSSYTVTLTATDPAGASASITVNVEVTDADDPATISTTSSISYDEGGTDPVATFTATDQDGDAIVWSLSGADAEDFTIEGGVLAFKSSPNYESAKDQGSDNTYNVTVRASGGSTDVAVTVMNVDETGTVGLSDLQPQGGESLTATISDEDSDSLDQVTWQWSKSMAEDGGWSDISGATSPTYTPKAGDVGYYLRATAEYSDGLGAGRDSASGVTAFAVEERPVANARPVFADDNDDVDGAQQSRDVRETAKVGDSVGNAVTASDADNDPLLYTLTDGDGDTTDSDTDTDTPSETDGDSTRFKIDRKTGQITTAVAMPDQDADTVEATSYSVTVTATDPSGSTNTVVVTISIVNVDEPPAITLNSDPGLGTPFTITREGDEFVVTTPEQRVLDLTGDPGDDSNVFASGLPVFNGDDPEDDHASIRWSISGPDARRFDIADVRADDAAETVLAMAALRWSADNRLGPSFEDMDSADGDNFYEVTVTAFDGVASKSQAVNIEVTNQEELGSVSLTQRVPQQGIAITAKLSDQDAGITGAKWQWYRGGPKFSGTTAATPADNDADIDGAVTIPATAPPNCTDDTADGTLCLIEGATSATYTPVLADANNFLTARVTYTDGLGAETNSARATSESNARERRDANTLPSFGDDESVDRSVEENANKANVGEPVAATDSDMGDLLLYTISDTTNFSVDENGQIKTAKALDYETQSSYTVTLTATDPSGASASITVNITVEDTDDGAAVILLTGNAPTFEAEEMTRSVAENTDAGMAIGDPVAATDVDGDALTYTLGGDDAGSFTIDSTGQLMTSAALDYETKASYTVTVTASSGKADEVDAMTTVTINVTDEGLDNAYDINENGAIERDEVVAAIQDYLGGKTSRSEVTELIRLYFGEDG